MVKISDLNYFLPQVQAFEAGRVLTSGRTRPMLMRGVCVQDGSRGDYVVKLKGSPQMFDDSFMNEIVGCFIAAELNLNTPEWVAVDVSPVLVETMEGHPNYQLAQQSIGLNFGTVLKDGYLEVLPGQAMPADLKNRLYDIFAFDVLIGNPDRRVDKPNFLSNGKDLLIYDHELAFSFSQVLPFARNQQPWTIPAMEMEWITKNYCFDLLRGNPWDYVSFAERLEALDQGFWDKADALIPVEWKTGNFAGIKTHVTSIVSHRQIFIAELNRILS